MKQSKYFITLFLPLLMVGINHAQASDILAEPATVPLEQKGMAWDHPSATVTGYGELKIEDSSANIPVDVSYKGIISCKVLASATANHKNKVEFGMGDFGREVEAKSKVGSIDVSDCTVTDADGITSAIAETAAMNGSKVRVEIEGLYTDVNGALKFSEYEAKGKVAAENRVKLGLKDGTIAMSPSVDTLRGVPLALEFRAGGFVSQVLIDVETSWLTDPTWFLDVEITGLNGGPSYHGTQLLAVTDGVVFTTNATFSEVIFNWTTDTVPQNVNEFYTTCSQVVHMVNSQATLVGTRKCVGSGPY